MKENKHKVEPKTWTSWDDMQREVFNSLFERMIESPWAFAHPDAAEVPEAHWRTTSWNAAFIAADMSARA